MTKFPTRETFAEAVVNSFTLSGKVTVWHWACCLEKHKNTLGQHYHVCQVMGPKRWNPVKNHLMSNHQIVVNFFECHATYYTAYKYVSKKACNVIHSQNHPNLQKVGSPKTKNYIKAYKQSRRKRRSLSTSNLSTPKTKRLQNIDISEFLVAIKTEEELMVKTQERFAEEKKDLKKFILSKSPKALQDLVTTIGK